MTLQNRKETVLVAVHENRRGIVIYIGQVTPVTCGSWIDEVM